MSWLSDAFTAIENVIGPTIVADIESILEAEFGILMTALTDVTLGVPVGQLLTNMLDKAGAMGRQDILDAAAKAPEALSAATAAYIAKQAVK